MKERNHDEHISCFSYNRYSEPIIQSYRFPEDAGFDRVMSQNCLVMVLTGEIKFSTDKNPEYTITNGHMILFSLGKSIKFFAKKNTSLILFRLKEDISFCERVSLEKLCKDVSGYKEIHSSLPINKRIYDYLSGFISYLDGGINCADYMEIKQRELSVILCMEYPKEELSRFFAPILNKHAQFIEFVITNYRKVKTVQALAELSHRSNSGFEKKFKKVFGISAYQWMNAQRAKQVYREINHSDKPFKEICDEYGFASLSHFNDFCYKYFGNSPGKIRNEII